MKKTLPIICCAFAALSAFAAAHQLTIIAWKPKAGATYHYKGHMLFHKVQSPAGVADLTFDEKMVATNKEIRPDGNIVVETKHTDFKVMLGDFDAVAMGAFPVKEINETVVEKPNGEVISNISDAPKEMQSARMDAISSFIFPDKPMRVGDTWVHTAEGDKNKGTYNTTTTFKYLGPDTVGSTPAYKCSMDYAERNAPTDITASGTFWIAQADGELLKAEITVKNAETGPGLPPSDADLAFERVSG